MTISMRCIERSDFENWLVLWDEYNAFYNRMGSTALPVEITRTTWSRFFESHEPVHCLVAEQNHDLVGIAQYIFYRSTTMLGPTCYVQDLFT